VFIRYETDDATAQIRLGRGVNAPLDDNSLTALRKELGDNGVRVCY
jgi:hypothetical protein